MKSKTDALVRHWKWHDVNWEGGNVNHMPSLVFAS